jgi:hypothetical protein
MGMLIFPQLTVYLVILSKTILEFCGYRPVLSPEYAQRAPLDETKDGLVKGSEGG